MSRVSQHQMEYKEGINWILNTLLLQHLDSLCSLTVLVCLVYRSCIDSRHLSLTVSSVTDTQIIASGDISQPD